MTADNTRMGGARANRPMRTMAKVTERKISDYQQDASNANKGTERGVYMLEHSLEEFGAGRSLLADKNGVLIAGNKTQERAADLGITDVIEVETDGTQLVVVKRTDLDLTDDPDKKARGMAYADNRAGEVGLSWDAERMLADLQEGIDLEQFFTDTELEEMLGDLMPDEQEDPGAQVDRAAELQEKWQTERGQVWQVGRHRVMCGDSTSAEDVERLMGDARADMVWTDPPYGVDYDGGRNASNVPRSKLQGDGNSEMYTRFIPIVAEATSSRAAWYIWFADRSGKPVYDAVAAAGLSVRAMIVWNKLDAHYGNFMAQYMQKHEACLYCVRNAPIWNGPTNEITVWDVKQPSQNKNHPTEKPLELATRAMKNSSNRDSVVADWFIGSGTAAVAAEQLGRICYGMEIDPSYVAVTLERLSGMGLEPVLVTN